MFGNKQLYDHKNLFIKLLTFVSRFLCFDFNPGFEFHGEVVGKNGDLLDELFYQSLIELCDVSFFVWR